MSAIDDTCKLLQDIITPDLKALSVRVDALGSRVDVLERSMKEGFAQSEKTMALNQKVMTAQYEALSQRIDAMLNSLQLERRIERLEEGKKSPLSTSELSRTA